MQRMEAPSQSGSVSRRIGGVSELERACVFLSLAMDSCRTPPNPPLGTRLTTSALLLEAFRSFWSFFLDCVLLTESACACA
jgi:hypothetical protein